MNNMELETDIEALDMEMGDITIHYCPVIPNPEGEPTAELKTADIEGTIYEIVDEEARTELENKVDKVEGKGLSENDYTDEDKAIVDGVTTALDGKVDKDGDKVLSDNNYSDTDKAIVEGVTEALNGKADKSDTYTKLEVDSALDNKVDKVGGKGLSANDFTDTLKDKLDGIEAEANKTVVDNSVTATSTNPVESKAIYNLLNDLLPEAEETGNPIAISNASGFNAKALTVDFTPIQDLHGYDKPWAGGSGKNKCNDTTLSVGYYDDQGRYQSQTSYRTSDFIPVKASTQYTNSFFDKSKTRIGGLVTTFWDSEQNFISQVTSQSYTTTPETAYIRVRSFQNQTTYINNDDYLFQVEEGGTPTAFEPYSNICPISGRTQTTVSVNSEDTTIQFGQTVYGGEVDVTSGGTSEEWELVDLGSLNWSYNNDYHFFITNLGGSKKTSTDGLCTNYPSVDFNTILSSSSDKCININTTDAYIRLKDSTYTDTTTFKQAMSGVKVCYKKATPTTISTPSNEISLLKGANTLVADGEMELVYSKIPQ